MANRIPASMRTREELSALIEGKLSTVSGKDELVKLATRLIVEEALEGETGDALGRDSRIRGYLKGHTHALENLVVELLARGLSVRDIEDAFKDENGRLLLSRIAVSELGDRLWEDYQGFAQRDLSEYEIVYLFVDRIAERLRPGQRREPVMAAWGITAEGRKVLLHLMAGSKEDAETVTAFFEDMKLRGLNDPLLVVSDGSPGIIKAIEFCFPRAARQRCLAHRMRNLAVKVPEDVWPEFKARAMPPIKHRAGQSPLATGLVADYGNMLATAVSCFMDDFEACIAHLRFPVTHRRAIRTTNLLERLFIEERRRLQDHPQRLRRESGLEADVRRHDRPLAREPDERPARRQSGKLHQSVHRKRTQNII